MALIQMEFMSTALQHFTSMNVLLPVDQWDRTETGPFPTLYLLHGWGGNYSDWVCNSRIALWAQQRGIAVVMPSGDNSYYLNYPEREENYETFICEELIALTRQAFPLSDKRKDTWIAGLSMGGGGAVRCGLRHGEVFSKAAGLSAGLTTGEEAIKVGHGADMKQALKDALADARPLPDLFLSIGTKDPLLADNREYHAFLQEKGIDHVYEEHSGGHTWQYWDGHLPDVLDWLQDRGAYAAEGSADSEAAAAAKEV